jgi:Carboxypeptidase regulatory-like domain
MERIRSAQEMDMTRYVPVALCGFLLLFASLALAQSTIQGVVKDNVGNGMQDVSVQVALSGATRSAKTDSDGRFAIAAVPGGVCTITFEADRYVTIKRQVKVPPSGTVSVDAVMSPEETVGVRQPPGNAKLPRPTPASL